MSADVHPAKPRLDLTRYELTVDGARAKLERQPMELLILFVRRKGQLVSREEIVETLWGRQVFVDADRSINAAVRKIRSALKDDPAHPKYLETVIGKGYRLVGDLEIVETAPRVEGAVLPAANRLRPSWPIAMSAIGMVAIVIGILYAYGIRGRPVIRSIAVLPLVNLSGDPSQDYFADGVTEELTTYLGKIHSLKVISRTSSQRYKDSHQSAPQIARELNAQAIVEGSVLRSGNRVRITIQLIDAIQDRHLWAESYDRDLGDVLTVQNTVALEIARQVRIRLTPPERQRLERYAPVPADAYDAYLRGRYSQSTQSIEGLKEGLPAFQQAISLDAVYAPAYAGLADSYSLLVNYQALSPEEAFPRAMAAAKKAMELDPTLAEAHTAAGYPEHHYGWNWAGAEREYQTAISLNPNFATAHLRYAELLSSEGRHDEAIQETHSALELDPLSLVYMANLGRFLYHARRYDEAIEVLTRTLALDPNLAYARAHLAMCYVEKGLFSQALEQYRRAFGNQAGPGLAHCYARSGDSATAAKMAGQLRLDVKDSQWFLMAGVYAALGDKDNAFFCLDKAREKHDFFLVFLKVHPFMDPLRSDARCAELIARLGLTGAKN